MSLGDQWYRALVEPIRPSVDAALEQAVPAGADLYGVPRSGLGGALALHVARGFGTRRWHEGGRVAAMVVEAYNQRVHMGSPARAARHAWLEHDVQRLRRVWGGLMRRDDALVRRVIDRLAGGTSDLAGRRASLGDHAVPEGVLFLRGAAAAGVLAGDVPDHVHDPLDRYATLLGLAWEAQQGTLSDSACEGALRAVGIDARPPPTSATRVASWGTELVREAIAELPGGTQAELLADLFGRVRVEASNQRSLTRWDPILAPRLAPSRPPKAVPTSLGAFRREWIASIEGAVADVTACDSQVLARATDYLRGHGGKRVRPLATLATCVACGADPAGALHTAALVECLHQASLVLDDVVDEARVRRGIPSLHAATSVPFAIGIAGFVIARIHHSLHDAPAAIRDRVVATATALVEGQRRELQLAGRADLSMTQYYRVIEAKTASLFACAAAVGAIAAGAGPQQVRAAARYGREAGLAFQIVDDLLDYIGDETTLGKRPGTDLRASKATAPVLTLRARLPASERATLDHYLAIRERSEAEWDDGLAWIRIEIGRHGIVEGCLDQARSHVGRAVSAMGALPNADGRGLLSALTASLVDRHR